MEDRDRHDAELERKEHLLEHAVDQIRKHYEELVTVDAELRAKMAALAEVTAGAQRERDRYLDLFDRLPLACLIVDRAGVVQLMNGVAVTLLGDSRRVAGRSVASLADSASASRVRERLAVGGDGDELLVRVQRPRGAAFDTVLTTTPVERARRILVTLRPLDSAPASFDNDVAALRRALRDKEELVARERALRAQLEKTERAKDRFIAILSHDLRGPINSVLGWTQLLRREQLPRESRERALETIERSSRAQLGLVEELLDLSRITADKVTLEIAPLDLGLMARALVESFVPVAADAGIALETDITTEGTTVFADRNRIMQIVSNLITNAMKFTPRGGRIEVRVRAEHAFAVLEVEDTGRGMTAEVLGEVFECYRQNCPPAMARSGLGLGLYIVKRLVHLHGGTVDAHSDGEGRGSKLTVRLPLREMTPTVASERSLPDDSTPDLDGMSILVVEDEPDARDLLATMLSGKGANVSVASDASQALAMFESAHPDVVVSDIEMPGEDGCALIGRLRRQSSDVPAIAVSGFAAEKDAERALAAGFDVHFPKPIEPRELVKQIQALAKRGHHSSKQ